MARARSYAHETSLLRSCRLYQCEFRSVSQRREPKERRQWSTRRHRLVDGVSPVEPSSRVNATKSGAAKGYWPDAVPPATMEGERGAFHDECCHTVSPARHHGKYCWSVGARGRGADSMGVAGGLSAEATQTGDRRDGAEGQGSSDCPCQAARKPSQRGFR